MSWDKVKKHWVKILTFFVATIIPLIGWFGGFIPDMVSAQDLQVYEKRIVELDTKQTELAIEFKRSELEDTEHERLGLEREIFKLQREQEAVPPFYIEQRLKYEQKINRLNDDIEDLRIYKLESLKSQGENK